MANEVTYMNWWWSDGQGDVNDATWHWLNAKFSDATFQIPHPVQGTNYFNITGNKYQRIKSVIKIGLYQPHKEDSCRIFIYKNKGHTSVTNSTNNLYSVSGAEPFIFYRTSMLAFPSAYFEANYEILYDFVHCRGASDSIVFTYEYKHEEILDIHSPYGLISIAILPNYTGVQESSFWIDTRTYFIG